MKYILFELAVFFAATIWMAASAWADDNYWLKIEELSRKDTPQGNPELTKYLKTLTKEQLLTALRQYTKAMEIKMPHEANWVFVPAMRIFLCYAEPLKRSDLSDEEYNKMRRGKKRRLEDGLVPARFTKRAFENVIDCISDRNEGTLFRYTLVEMFGSKEFYSILSKAQKMHLFDTCLEVLKDHAAPDMVRSKCCDIAKETLQQECWQLIHADGRVKELMGSGLQDRQHTLESLLISGEIRLTTKTIELLVPWMQRVEDFRKEMVALQSGEQTPESLRKLAAKYVSWLDDLPLMKTKGGNSIQPTDSRRQIRGTGQIRADSRPDSRDTHNRH